MWLADQLFLVPVRLHNRCRRTEANPHHNKDLLGVQARNPLPDRAGLLRDPGHHLVASLLRVRVPLELEPQRVLKGTWEAQEVQLLLLLSQGRVRLEEGCHPSNLLQEVGVWDLLDNRLPVGWVRLQELPLQPATTTCDLHLPSLHQATTTTEDPLKGHKETAVVVVVANPPAPIKPTECLALLADPPLPPQPEEAPASLYPPEDLPRQTPPAPSARVPLLQDPNVTVQVTPHSLSSQ